jgi:hypothetical protein
MTDVLDESGKLAETEFGLVTIVPNHRGKGAKYWGCGLKVTLISVGRMPLDDPPKVQQSDGSSVSIVCGAESAGEGSQPSATLEP